MSQRTKTETAAHIAARACEALEASQRARSAFERAGRTAGPAPLARANVKAGGTSNARARAATSLTHGRDATGPRSGARVCEVSFTRGLQEDPSRKLGPTSRGKLRAAQPVDDGSSARRLSLAQAASADAACVQRSLRKAPAMLASAVADDAALPRNARRALRLAAFNAAKRAKLAAQAVRALPVSSAVEGPTFDSASRDAGGCVPSWGAAAFTRKRETAR